ncbi:MAG: DUF6883 domain-containing protein [Dehalococcoidia bacterium]
MRSSASPTRSTTTSPAAATSAWITPSPSRWRRNRWSAVEVKLPNGGGAYLEIGKLQNYCLNPDHERGQHKARVFASALGFTRVDAQRLGEALLQAAADGDVVATPAHEHGQQFMIDFELEGIAGPVVIRSTWLIRHGESFPRFATCYVYRGAGHAAPD